MHQELRHVVLSNIFKTIINHIMFQSEEHFMSKWFYFNMESVLIQLHLIMDFSILNFFFFAL